MAPKIQRKAMQVSIDVHLHIIQSGAAGETMDATLRRLLGLPPGAHNYRARVIKLSRPSGRPQKTMAETTGLRSMELYDVIKINKIREIGEMKIEITKKMADQMIRRETRATGNRYTMDDGDDNWVVVRVA